MALSPSSWKRSTLLIRALALFLVMGALAILASTAHGQATKYEVLKVEELIDKNMKTVQREARGYATARDVSAIPQNRVAVVQRYFSQYVPAKITQPDSLHLINDIMGHARATMQSAVRSRTPGAANVMRWLYGGLKPVATGNYQPAARINAIQFIARLAKPPAQRGGLPVPYSFVLTDMMTIYKDASAPDAVRAAALQGIDRFVQLAPQDDAALTAAKAELKQEMTNLLQSDPPASRDELAHAFLQRYAVNILTNLSTDASLGKEFVSISTNAEKPNLIALHSAAAIANLPGKMAEGDVETKQVLMDWSKRILASYEAEIERLGAMSKSSMSMSRVSQPPAPETFLKATEEPKDDKKSTRRMGGSMEDMMGMDDSYDEEMMGMDDEMGMEDMMSMMGGGSGMGMMRMSPEQKQPAEIIATRRKLNYVIQQVLVGLTGQGNAVEDVDALQATGGLMAATPADSMENTKEWLQTILDLTAQLNDKTVGTTRDFVKILEEQKEDLLALSEGKSVEPKAIAEAPIFGFGAPEESGPPQDPSAKPEEPAVDPGLEGLLN